MTTRAEHVTKALSEDEYQVLIILVKTFGAPALIELIEEIAKQLTNEP